MNLKQMVEQSKIAAKSRRVDVDVARSPDQNNTVYKTDEALRCYKRDCTGLGWMDLPVLIMLSNRQM